MRLSTLLLERLRMISTFDESAVYWTRPLNSLSLGLMPDEELVSLAQAGIPSAAEPLVSRYRDLVRLKANRFFLRGADRDDILQEGMIGLFKAIRSYRPDRHQNFEGFADLCIRRQIQTAVKASLRHKHRVLNSAVETTSELELRAARSASRVGLRDRDATDLSLFLGDHLTQFERAVLEAYLAGHSYSEIGKELSCLPKYIDNALQRVKRKVLVMLRD